MSTGVGKRRVRVKGFTIVELLIVIVVIAILAAITIVSYNGIQSRTREAAVQSDVANAVKKLEVMKLRDEAQNYPASIAATNLKASAGNTYYYQYVNSDNSYCVQSSNGLTVWYASSDQTTPRAGTCGSDSLVGQWTFNGNANDSSGNGLDGTVVKATLATGQDGRSNGAYSFPGTAAYITMGNSTLFNRTELTMSIWANTTTVTPVAQALMAKEGKYKYRIAYGSKIEALAAVASGWTNQPSCAISPITTDTWYHFVFTVSSAKARIKLYVNGTEVCSVAGPVITSFNTSDFMVGSHNVAGNEGFYGSLDDARFYSRALSAAEIKGLYDAGAQ